jgi:hypothetical protein
MPHHDRRRTNQRHHNVSFRRPQPPCITLKAAGGEISQRESAREAINEKPATMFLRKIGGNSWLEGLLDSGGIRVARVQSH